MIFFYQGLFRALSNHNYVRITIVRSLILYTQICRMHIFFCFLFQLNKSGTSTCNSWSWKCDWRFALRIQKIVLLNMIEKKNSRWMEYNLGIHFDLWINHFKVIINANRSQFQLIKQSALKYLLDVYINSWIKEV